jgi:type IV secretion system protein VirD4
MGTSTTNGSTSPLETVLLAGLGGVVALGATVWLGAVGSSLVTGRQVNGIGLAGAIRAVPQLIVNPSEPGSAWPASARSGIAGPVAYWSATVLVAVVIIGAAVVVWGWWRRLAGGRRRLGVDAHARFATRRELRPLLISAPVPGRFVFGRWGNRLVATENRRWAPRSRSAAHRMVDRVTGGSLSSRDGDMTSIAICGPTRCGKTSQCAVPGLLDWAGPAVVLSVKRDLMDATITRRRKLGSIRVFDPGGLLKNSLNSHITIEPEEVARWSPLRTAHTATGMKKAGESLAAWTPKAGVDGGMDFWATQGKLLFTGLLGAAALSPNPSMLELAGWVFDMVRPSTHYPCDPQEILNRKLQDPDPQVREAADSAIRHLNSIWNKPDDRILASVYSTAQTVCDPWLDPNVVAATDLHAGAGDPGTGWVDLDWLMNTGPEGDMANTLYLLVSQDDYKRLAPVLAGLISDLKGQVYEWDMEGREMPAPLLMLIDEAGNIPLSWLPEVSSTCVGLGIQLVTIWQSLAQIHESYGKRADILLTNHATKLFFPGASDDATLGYASKIVGEESIERRSWSRDVGGAKRSISGQESREPLVPYFLTRLPTYGSALLIHSNLPPAHIQGRKWWRDRRLAAMVPARPTPTDPTASGSGPWTPTPIVVRPRPAWATDNETDDEVRS